MAKPKVKASPGWDESSPLRKTLLMAQEAKKALTPKPRPYDPMMGKRKAEGKATVVDAMFGNRMTKQDALDQIERDSR